MRPTAPWASGAAKSKRRLLVSPRRHGRRFDPYPDYNTLVIQFGFVTMFSLVWPPVALAVVAFNVLKVIPFGSKSGSKSFAEF